MRSNTAAQISTIAAKPILKWAGGKTQMLGELLPKVPSSYGRYIEPFFGGGALFFALQPENAVIADSNPELINMYRQVADHVDGVISYLEKYQNTSEMFYSVRSLDWETLPKAEAAARTIYLNRTCYNGLYRVNKKGQFAFFHYIYFATLSFGICLIVHSHISLLFKCLFNNQASVLKRCWIRKSHHTIFEHHNIRKHCPFTEAVVQQRFSICAKANLVWQ